MHRLTALIRKVLAPRPLNALAAQLFVRPCLGCSVLSRLPLAIGLCTNCLSRLVVAPRVRCRSCGRPGPPAADTSGGADRLGWHCPGCPPPAPPGTSAAIGAIGAIGAMEVDWAWSYEPPIDRVVRAFKLGGLEPLGRELGRALWWAQGWSVALRLGRVDWVAPVPTTWWREARRGFNSAEEIARPLAAALDAPILSLRRSSLRPHQRSLDRRHRLGNLRGAFRVPPGRSLKGARILLIDDVVTTGATLETLGRLLCDAGAARVVGLAACRTPAPEEIRRSRTAVAPR